MSRYPKLKFDQLKMYFGEPYEVNCEDALGKITVYQPTIGDIIECGESVFYPTLSLFVTNTTSYRLFLWDAGLDWNEVTDFQLFGLLYKTINPEAAKLMFGNLDWSSFEVFFRGSEMVMASKTENIEINEDVYEHIHQYLQNVFNMKPEEEFTKDPILKKWWVDKDRRKAKREENEKEKPSFSMVASISSFVNHPGTKYKLKELKEVGVCEFYDALQRLQIYENSIALLRGSMSGFVDTKKLKSEEMNFMRNINKT